jgi:hypothetical protein
VFGLVVGKSAAVNREHEDRDVWFVHATDPHLFLKEVDEKKDAEAAAKKKRQEELNRKALSDMLKRMRSLPGGEGPSTFLVLTGDLGIDPCEIPKGGNQSVTTTGAEAGTPPPTEAQNGDKQRAKDKRSAQDCVNAVDTEKRKEQIEKIAELLGESPVPIVYLVAGNNDIAKESAGDEALTYFNDFIDDVQKALIKNKSSVILHNLTRCYALGGEPARCYADINTAYRLIGFPSYSFKGAKDEAGLDHNQAQAKQFETFRQLLERSQQAGKKVLVITHTPEMNDPYLLAQSRYVNPPPPATAAPTETGTPTETPTPAETATPAKKKKTEAETTETTKETEKKTRAQTETNKVWTWNVNPEVLDGWKDAIASDSVVGVFAGHLHDSHKEIYQRPYTWSSGSKTAFHKLFLAPPLAVKNQDNSPIQARGFSLIHLQPDHIVSRLYWYNSETREFSPDPQPKDRCEQHRFWRSVCRCPRAIIIWFWNLDKADNPLTRMAVLLIAFLTAFLTVVAIWQIPPPSDPFGDDKKTADGASRTAQASSNAQADSSPFANRFGKTVIAGLSGLAVTEVAKSLGGEKSTADSRWYYVVWFILFFFLLLIGLNLWRAALEALRARVAVAYYPLRKTKDVRAGDVFKHWLPTLRVPVLTFFDTFINLIQGKNQTRTQVFEKTIIDQQRNVIRVAEAIRTNLNSLLEGYVGRKRQTDSKAQASISSDPVPPNLVRVNISVLSKDQTYVYYISWASASSRSPFPKRSVAWLSVFTGKIRWYKKRYVENKEIFKEIVLFNNSDKTIAEDPVEIHLEDHFQVRGGSDYDAFVVFPVPSLRRDKSSDYVKGAIHISFRYEEDFDRIWNFSVTPEKPAALLEAAIKRAQAADAAIKNAKTQGETETLKPHEQTEVAADPQIAKHLYDFDEMMLGRWCPDDAIRTALNTNLTVLGELLRGFNEVIYQSYIETNQPD